MSRPASVFASDLRLTPYWWERTPRPEIHEEPLPDAIDVLIIGSGFTGLSAGLETARGGRKTLIIDAETVGFGCSTRNGGQISTSVKPGFTALARRVGAERAAGIITEGKNSLAWVGDFVAREGIDCDFRVGGRFHAAHNPRRYAMLARRIAAGPRELRAEAELVPRSEQRREIGTDAYFGGVLYTRHASIDPGRFHQGMLEGVLAAGAKVAARCPATAISRERHGFRIATPRGVIAAREVVVATNGYTGGLTPWLRRRAIPIGSYIIATEPIGSETMARLMPGNRIVSDTRKVVYYYRTSPDGRRVLFGGRVSLHETDAKVSGPLLHVEMVRIFPELASIRITHSWSGFIAYSFDELMHIGRHDGIWYAMGYCGSGVGMAGYLGMRLGQQVLGREEGRTAFDDVGFETRPFYHGNPWFLAPSVMYYRWRDRFGR
ncbi:MAG: NAD(P)/FAD-dependent oxidoreductase [Stellaceae bacterium]